MAHTVSPVRECVSAFCSCACLCSQCTKPLPVNREGHDVHCVVVWGGKVLTEEQLARSFPTFIETAARRAKDMLATQVPCTGLGGKEVLATYHCREHYVGP